MARKKEEAQEPAAQSLWDRIKGWFTTAKESEAAEKAGDFAEKAWDKTKEVSTKAWEKTKDAAEDVKDKYDEKMEERRTRSSEGADDGKGG